jgi:hypothetical protein
MKLPLDTHILLWAAEGAVGPTGPPPDAPALAGRPAHDLFF